MLKLLDQILQDQSDLIEIDIYYNGVLTTPTTCTITSIKNSAGTAILEDQATIAGGTTGRRKYTVAADYTETLGIYTATWEFVIATTTFIHVQQYEVVTSFRDGYCSPEEIRDYATYDKITTTSPTDAVLTKYIKKATALVDQFLGGSIEYSQYVDKVRCVLDRKTNGLHMQLKHRPIISLTSVTVTTNVGTNITPVTLTVSGLRTNDKAAYVEYFGGEATYNYSICLSNWAESGIIPVATVTYTAGYTNVPKDVMLATTYLAEQLYRAENGDDNWLSSFTIGDYTEKYGKDRGNKNIGQIGADIVYELLKGYRQPTRTGFYGTIA